MQTYRCCLKLNVVVNMNIKFKQKGNNRLQIQDNENIEYLVDLAMIRHDLLNDILTLFKLNKKNSLKYLNKQEEYLFNIQKEIPTSFNKIRSFLEVIHDNKFANYRGAFLEKLIFKFIKNCCNYDEVHREVSLNFDGVLDSHPFDTVVCKNGLIHLIDVKYSCLHLDKKDLDYLVKHKRKFPKMIFSYFICVDEEYRLDMRFKSIKKEYNIGDDKFKKLMDDINWIPRTKLCNYIINEKCFLN